MLLLTNQGVATAQVEQPRSFPQTGHWVSGAFLEKYESVPNPEIVFGYPLTEAFESHLSRNPSGTLIQYFEHARFELHPDNPADLQVTLTLVGEYFYGQDEYQPVAEDQPSPYSCRDIPADGLPVCYAFLQYFDRNGGIGQFGYPVSKLVTHDGRMVQYFQRAIFEWHPEMSSGHKVVLSDIGIEYFYALNEDVGLLQLGGDIIPVDQVVLHVSAFVERAVMPSNSMQRLYVVVQNQALQYVSGVHVTIQVVLPSGEKQNFSMPLTNAYGISQLEFVVGDQTAGLVRVIVNVRTFDQLVTTVTSFRIWK